jgi:hypothetical protein
LSVLSRNTAVWSTAGEKRIQTGVAVVPWAVPVATTVLVVPTASRRVRVRIAVRAKRAA